MEVFPRRIGRIRLPPGLLHVRGGVSLSLRQLNELLRSSPRPWRCFLLRGGRSVRRRSLLHVRGGVSAEKAASDQQALSSPRPWRCFQNEQPSNDHDRVFSTSVEVFLQAACFGAGAGRLLHVRGGVSSKVLKTHCQDLVFSTSVEVFLARTKKSASQHCLLHVRGGVSRMWSRKARFD